MSLPETLTRNTPYTPTGKIPLLQADALMKSKGYAEDHWITKYFPGEAHTEQAWHKRLAIPLTFLLGN